MNIPNIDTNRLELESLLPEYSAVMWPGKKLEGSGGSLAAAEHEARNLRRKHEGDLDLVIAEMRRDMHSEQEHLATGCAA